MKNYKAQGVVLHTVKYGDSSLIAYLYTNLRGRTTYLVRGVHSGKGNKAALLQPMFLLEFEGSESPHSDLHHLKDARTITSLSAAQLDIRKNTIALFMAEVLYRLIREEEANPPLFAFITETIRHLNELHEGVSNFHLWFLVRLSAYLGFYPNGIYQANDFFDLSNGQFVRIPPLHGLFFERNEAHTLAQLMDADAYQLAQIKLNHDQRSRFLTALLRFISYHFDAVNTVRSVDILRQVF